MIEKIKKILNKQSIPLTTQTTISAIPAPTNFNMQVVMNTVTTNRIQIKNISPPNPVMGEIMYNVSTKKMNMFDGKQWIELPDNTDSDKLAALQKQLEKYEERVKMFLNYKNILEDEFKEYNESIDVCEKLEQSNGG